ncbi:expressed unknown protein [Ectocarpus siliculosus]|uniref:Uncharacterized protein n=1 Tax=Ectocarpus siliculosus TaxID=2880 RepID=D7FJL6_ECTSI|nr:expressed unknown protein [Ectocarpus siliculosus]|eukprot:CBJ29118.1 expressed unknown protein [Ectocarpus siliculosus]
MHTCDMGDAFAWGAAATGGQDQYRKVGGQARRSFEGGGERVERRMIDSRQRGSGTVLDGFMGPQFCRVGEYSPQGLLTDVVDVVKGSMICVLTRVWYVVVDCLLRLVKEGIG